MDKHQGRESVKYEDRSSPQAYYIRQEELVREYQVAVESMAIMRERLAHCVRSNTVNQFVACKNLRESYFALCTDRYHGMIFPPDMEPPNRQIPGLIAPIKLPEFVTRVNGVAPE
jgi:exopolysaccharide biosynthesis predicted pyruvyltransferase EpsI